MPPPLFENFSLHTLNSEEKPFAKKPVDRAGQKPVGQPAMILKFTGRVEKILTVAISGVKPSPCVVDRWTGGSLT